MLSQADIARKTGYNPKQISLWFRGMQVMTLDEAESMFDAAGARFVDEYVRAKELVRQGAEAGDLAHDGQTDDDSTAGGSAAM